MISKSSKNITKLFPLFLFALLSTPNLAHAHLIGGNGLMSGITHPLFGPDHLLAMVAVGIISTQIGNKAVWKVPATFVTFMIIGGLLAIGGLSMPIAEMGIALSVLFFGVLIAFYKPTSIYLSMLLVAVFAIFHGHAHGEEIPLIANPAFYTIGFVLSTTCLHISGVLIGHYAQKTNFTQKMLQFAGAGISIMGVIFIFGL